MSRIRIASSCLFLASSSLSAAAAILTEIQLKTDPDTVRVRPFDSLFVQVLAYAEVEEDGEKKKVQISGGGTQFSLRSNNGGWLSKPFRFRGRKADSLVDAGLQSFFGASRPNDFGVDAVLYTAPQQTGSYEIEAQLKGKKAKVKIIGVRCSSKSVPGRAMTMRPPSRSLTPKGERMATTSNSSGNADPGTASSRAVLERISHTRIIAKEDSNGSQ